MENNDKELNMLLQQKKALEHTIKQMIEKEKLGGPEIEEGFLKGQICLKKIRCGKKNCRCANGTKEQFGHGPYPHLQWWEGDKIKTRYLNRKKHPIYEKILYYQKNLKLVNKKIEEIEKENKKGKLKNEENK